ncbi:MAG: hypothetical protein RBT05_01565 [Bacteroidales bacterium]|jgi:hypothetical protein|nr:hypothetical protein [Bacteroidales bacterium]
MKVYITNKMRFNAAMNIVISLLENELITLEEYTLIIKHLEFSFDIKESNTK